MNNVVYKDDENYPKLLKQIAKDTPKQIYWKGDWDNSIFENCLTVIGSRKLTNYGQQVIEQLVGEIALAGITIVSGFMYGGDAVAHKAAVKVGGRTIAVMPCGIDRIHPEYQKELYQEILDNNGLIVSEYEGDMGPALWTYPRRNRIAAGLSKALLIIEAGEKSGCLITANFAKKFNRKIFVAPGPITSSVSKGSNALIKEGAEMVLSAKDVLRYYRDKASKTKFSESLIPTSLLKSNEARVHTCDSENLFSSQDTSASQKIKNTRSQSKSKNLFSSHKVYNLKNTEKQIIDLLEREPLEIDELSRNLGIPVSELGVKLSMMQIKGLIKLRGNKYGIN